MYIYCTTKWYTKTVRKYIPKMIIFNSFIPVNNYSFCNEVYSCVTHGSRLQCVPLQNNTRALVSAYRIKNIKDTQTSCVPKYLGCDCNEVYSCEWLRGK